MFDAAPVRTPVELAHDAYMNHVLGCPSCYAPSKRYCSVGLTVRADYDARYILSIADTHRRKTIMHRDFVEDPVYGQLLKDRVIELYDSENLEA